MIQCKGRCINTGADTVLLRCEPGSGRRARTAVAPKEWVPCHFHHETQSPTASPMEGRADSIGISNNPLHPWPVTVNSQSAEPLGHQGHLSAFLDSQAGVGPSERPCPREAEERGGVQHLLWRVPMDVHRADRQDTGSSSGRAPTGSQKRGCISFSNC